YQLLTSRELSRDGFVPSGALRQVLHGCRQLVSWAVRLSPATSATLVPSCPRLLAGPPGSQPGANQRKVGAESSHHGPYDLGYTRATMGGTKGCQAARWS